MPDPDYTDPDYTNREIDRMFQEIKVLLIDIKEQTTKTNGRVTKLEFWKEGLMAKLTGIAATISVGWILVKEFIFK